MLDHIETVWETPALVRFVEALTRFARVIVLDRRGTGLSDRVPPETVFTLDEQADDVRACARSRGDQQWGSSMSDEEVDMLAAEVEGRWGTGAMAWL